jgi:hypothetical protein
MASAIFAATVQLLRVDPENPFVIFSARRMRPTQSLKMQEE